MKKSAYISCAAWLTHPDRVIFKKEQIENRIKWIFEDAEFYIPKDYDNVLRTTYGDYMQLPPRKAKRVHHHLYKAYRVEK